MLGVLWARPPKPWILSPHTFSLSHLHPHPHPLAAESRLFHHPSGASIWRGGGGGGGVDDWRRDYLRRPPVQSEGEGSWNVAWDARPARWLNRLDLVYLLVGVLLKEAVNSEFVYKEEAVVNLEEEDEDEDDGEMECGEVAADDDEGDGDLEENNSGNYRVTGVLADGRCLFRAVAHGACLRSGEEAPDENRQRELADDLRARVVDEFLKRREEIECFIEEDFDAYVKRIQEPYVWGGELELLMASHYLRTPISVFMKDKTSSDLKNIANYGEEYNKEKEVPINVLFHRYGHYEILETSSDYHI